MCNMCLHLDINWCRIWLILLNISSSGFHECRHINISSFSKCAPASFPFPNESPQEKNQHACDAPEAGFGSSTSLKPEIFNIRSILYTYGATELLTPKMCRGQICLLSLPTLMFYHYTSSTAGLSN